MKNDPTFKFAAIAILAGVIVSFITPSPAPNADAVAATPEIAPSESAQ